MSLLPQRKKSAGEIAKLRETLGVPGQAPVAEEPPAAEPASAVVSRSKVEIPQAEPVAKAPAPKPGPPVPDAPEPEPDSPPEPPATDQDPLPVITSHAPRPVRSLKRSERVPVPPVDEPAPVKVTPAPAHHTPKVVHSLRKSELVPLAPAGIHTPPADSKLPAHRHSDRELNDLRRKAAITAKDPAVYYAGIKAHLALLIPGYLFAIAGGVCFYYYELSINVTTACVAAALLIAGFIFLKKPLSRHHAAFITMMSLFVIVFGALHYFPRLSYGTVPLPAEEESVIHKDL